MRNQLFSIRPLCLQCFNDLKSGLIFPLNIFISLINFGFYFWVIIWSVPDKIERMDLLRCRPLVNYILWKLASKTSFPSPASPLVFKLLVYFCDMRLLPVSYAVSQELHLNVDIPLVKFIRK
ncbi:hypothetical protein CIPAW_10G044500 [Carya illinoinensis]|uniref:Uncharacterized protein n=1 Tax=Carya illinoinensis TaxID=32201 RepID=A0A8T1P2A4_CARIL|nr:hypothetical protein CIPAW_10G044500 [Carya illinoinensis]KAG6691032.1 hypothetical protein I3842_10G043800 [Carya illinoinensis]